MKKKRRRLGRQAGLDLAGEVALDQRHRDQHGQADAERQHDLARSARPAGADWRAPGATPGGAAGRACLAPKITAAPAARNSDEGGDRAGDEPQRDGPVLRAGDGQRRERRAPAPRSPPAPTGGTRRRARVDHVAEQRAGRHPADRGERPQREDQRRQQAVERRQAQRRRIEAEPGRDRQHAGEERRRPRAAAARRAPAPAAMPSSASAMISIR